MELFVYRDSTRSVQLFHSPHHEDNRIKRLQEFITTVLLGKYALIENLEVRLANILSSESRCESRNVVMHRNSITTDTFTVLAATTCRVSATGRKLQLWWWKQPVHNISKSLTESGRNWKHGKWNAPMSWAPVVRPEQQRLAREARAQLQHRHECWRMNDSITMPYLSRTG